MINRYETNAMKKIWDYEERLALWLKFQITVCEAWTMLKVIPESDFVKIKSKVKLDLLLMKQLEATTQHDVVAFTRMLSHYLGAESRWIHFGLTSTDMVDTVQNYQLNEATTIIKTSLVALQNQLKLKAMRYKNQLVIGRTHGIFAEPTSLGLKFALWYDEINRQIIRLVAAQKDINVTKITGSVGNYAHVEIEISEYVAKKWQMNVEYCTTQVTQRDRHINLISTLANIATTIEKIALEIRLSQRSEIQELLEGFSKLQKGSSSMPHKKNPIGSENICGLVRLICSYTTIAYQNNSLWYERDISHSSNERIMLPDIFHALHFIILRMTKILEDLIVNLPAIANNINKTNNIYFSQTVLLAIIKNNPIISRETAYDFIQKCTFITNNEQIDFKVVLENNNISQYLTKEQLSACFDNQIFLQAVTTIYQKVF